MTRERTNGDGPPTDAPDWFDAGMTEDDATPATDERDRLEDEVGDWFTDPDHQPVGPDVASADAPADEPENPAPDPVLEEGEIWDEEPSFDPDEVGPEADATDAITSPSRREEQGPGPTERTETIETTEGAPVTATGERSGTTHPAPDSSVTEPEPDADEAVPAADTTDADATAADRASSRREERGTGVAEPAKSSQSAETPASNDTASSIQRLIAWLRSVFGR